jgi:hypothetical protein
MENKPLCPQCESSLEFMGGEKWRCAKCDVSFRSTLLTRSQISGTSIKPSPESHISGTSIKPSPESHISGTSIKPSHEDLLGQRLEDLLGQQIKTNQELAKINNRLKWIAWGLCGIWAGNIFYRMADQL